MYYTINEYAGSEKGYIVSGKSLNEITEKVKVIGRANGDEVLHITKRNMGYGMLGRRTHSTTSHRVNCK